ncbi:MAG: hypothetical protein JWM59_4556, partial [Verrucomicrobiales bacterium]|nr:hypothetical protein [Verrucomicrobiales bacterium]
MNIRLRCLTLLLWSIFAPCGQAGSLAGRTQQLASPDEVPEGLAQSDWQGIRAAYEAGR